MPAAYHSFYLLQEDGGKLLLEPSDGVSAIILHETDDVRLLYSHHSKKRFWDGVNARKAMGGDR